MSAQPLKEVKPRKAKARKIEVIVGCMDEVCVIAARTTTLDGTRICFDRFAELVDEAQRSLNRVTEEE